MKRFTPMGMKETEHNSLLRVFGTLGFFTMFAWQMLCLFSDLFLNNESQTTILFMRMIYFAVAALMLFILSFFSDRINLRFLLTIAIICQFALPIYMLIGTYLVYENLAIEFLCWALSGLSLSTVTMAWVYFFGRFNIRSFGSSILLAVAFAAIFIVGIAAMYIPVNYLAFAALIPCSAAILLINVKLTDPIPFADRKTSAHSLKLSGRAHFGNLMIGICFGVISGVMINYLFSRSWYSIIIIGVAVALAAVSTLVLNRFHPQSLYPGNFTRLLYPFVIAGLLIIPYLEEFNTVVCLVILCLALGSLIAYDVLNWTSLAGLSNRYLVSPFYLAGRGRIPLLAGQGCGWLIAFAVLLLSQGGVLLIVSMVLAVGFSALIIVLPRVPESAYYLFDGNENYEIVPINPESRSAGHWKNRCEEIARGAMLSTRETEIFLLLAKGRNAVFIKEKLFISQHTAKTHIYHIYKKLGLSTHQQLIDLVESYRSEDEEID